jgi:tRNA-specific 2-thiouridylase
LTQQQLSRTLFPIGNYTKREVRKLARQKNLPVHQRPESQDICFIPDNDYISFLRKRIPMVFRTGPIVDLNNRTLGQHEGVIHFTIGQRKGMGLASTDPVYVLEIHPEKNQIVVGRDEFLFKKKLIVSGINLIDPDVRRGPIPVKAKIRYKHREAKALLTILDEKKACLRFEKSQRAVTPGQSAVFYDGDVVIGGGIIEGECV